MNEKFEKPKSPEATNEITNDNALADLLQRRRTELGKTDRSIAKEISEILGHPISLSTISHWNNINNPSFPSEDKLQAVSTVYGLSIDEVKRVREKAMAVREKFLNIRKKPQAPKVDPVYDVFGEGGPGKIGHRTKVPNNMV